MPKFTLKCDISTDYKVSSEFEKETLTEVVEALDTFLRGCGYFFDDLRVYSNLADSRLDDSHDSSYYDFDRNR